MRKKNRTFMILMYGIALLVGISFLYPIFWMITSSLKPTKDIFIDTLRIIPRNPTLNAYRSLRTLAGIPFGRYLFNSVYIVAFSVVISVVVTSLAAYAVNRHPNLPGFQLLEKLFLFSIMYPYMLLMIPVYIIMFQLGLLGTYTGIIFFLCLGPIQYYLFREFFSKIPQALIDSAGVDGASEGMILLRIVLPMARPVFMTAILLTFILNWDNWFPVLVISTSMHTYTLPVALFNLDSQLEVNFPEIMALSTVVTAPIIFIFLITQKKVIEGFAAGSVKE